MAVDTYADVTDVAKRLRRPISDPLEIQAVTVWLEDAESAIRVRIPDLEAVVTDDKPLPFGKVSRKTLVLVESRAAARVANNPDGYRSVAIDDVTRVRDRDLSDGQVRITDADWAELLPWTSTAAVAGGYTIDLGTPL